MSTIMPDSTITIEGFVVDDDDGTPRITYLEKRDLTGQLHTGARGVVLVKLYVDEESLNEVEVEGLPGMNTQADTIDAAIESLIVVRDILRKGVTLEETTAAVA